jgi:hypothetical protein
MFIDLKKYTALFTINNANTTLPVAMAMFSPLKIYLVRGEKRYIASSCTI